MNNETLAIKAESISKRYRIGLKEELHDSMVSTMIDMIKSPLKNFRKYRSLYKFEDDPKHQETAPTNNTEDVIWALRNVSMEVRYGEVLGIIGNNGAGKSTLLKILSRITDPTYGQAETRGRVASLLEVGTGFHGELTGRENVYLNGTVLGMSKKEIDQKFDEIIDFSGIEKFIDTPVKRYSSGMKVRLAFSVAAHLEPDIMIIDEVLAVGDAAFQKKCLNKMEDVGKYGRTVLFVSHNMSAITRICPRTIRLENGTIVDEGPTSQVVSQYLTSGSGTSAERVWNEHDKAPAGDVVRLRAVRALSETGMVSETFDIRRPIRIEMEYDVLKAGKILNPHFHFYNSEGVYLFIAIDNDRDWRKHARDQGSYKSIVTIPGNLLSEGMLYVTATMHTLEPVAYQFRANDSIVFNVLDSQDGDSARADWTKNLGGAVRPLFNWETHHVESGGDS